MVSNKKAESTQETKDAKARRSLPGEFPQWIVKDGAGKAVNDPVELKEALADGWREPGK